MSAGFLDEDATKPLVFAKPRHSFFRGRINIGLLIEAPGGDKAPNSADAPAKGDEFNGLLDDAICLLKYADEAGIVVEADLAQRIIAAKQLGNAAWADASAGSLLSDITKLGALLHPVTAVTLRACKTKQAHDTISSYKRIAIWLAVLIIPWSVFSYVFTGINNSIAADLATANRLSVSLHVELAAPASRPGESAQVSAPNALSDLQEFAATIRSVYRHTKQLNWFVLGVDRNPVTTATRLELDTDLSPQTSQLRTNLDQLTAAYQEIRSYAKYTQDDGAAVYGAVTSCILPIFYALLGACAYSLRVFSGQLAARTFAPCYSTSARFVVAAITGGVVGLFNNFGVSQLATLSPLAIAFLAGYAADVFFAFLDGAVQSVTKSRAG